MCFMRMTANLQSTGAHSPRRWCLPGHTVRPSSLPPRASDAQQRRTLEDFLRLVQISAECAIRGAIFSVAPKVQHLLSAID